MSVIGSSMERQPITTPIHQVYPKEVLQKKLNLKVMVWNKQENPLES